MSKNQYNICLIFHLTRLDHKLLLVEILLNSHEIFLMLSELKTIIWRAAKIVCFLRLYKLDVGRVTIFLEIYKLFLDKKELGKIDFV